MIEDSDTPPAAASKKAFKPPIFNPRQATHPQRIGEAMTAYAQNTTGDVQALAYCCASLAYELDRLRSELSSVRARSNRFGF